MPGTKKTKKITAKVRIRIGAKRQITLPADAASKFGLSTGDELEARIFGDRIELVPMVAVPKDQAWFWTPEWQAREREAEKARAAGEYTEFGDVNGLISALKK
ncbi:AbrB/MazE/SpoVT family DNA-binding domain-containing protein [Acidobacteriia bacterium AH_259_A11_L15]|nr:AbrB/MazE/SpoVT family DNA-binding domain-containing protein [Acidobacteriia bacterium AH_259_A11_L15]